ncbi:MAG: GNAT family N-acetyltransferase [Candidatus Aminicenantales bacterium]
MPPLICSMRSEDLAFAAECPAREGWTSETLDVFEGFFAHDPDGCFVAEDAGRPAGICLATSYGSCGFIGDLIVRREVRGGGFGPALLDAAVRYLKGRGAESIFLDGVKKAVPFYELSGFRPLCLSLRFAGWADEISQDVGRPETARLRPMRTRDLPGVFELDREAFGADRSFFLERLRSLDPELAWVAEDGGGIAGFILGHTGYGIVAAGPWVMAEQGPRSFDLLAPVLERAGEGRFRLGVLETNDAVVRFLRSIPGLAGQPPSLRMVLGPTDRLGNSPMCRAIGSPAKG